MPWFARYRHPDHGKPAEWNRLLCLNLLIAIGAAAKLLPATNNVLQLFGDLPLAPAPSCGLWDTKIIGLAIIFIYAFYKFSWSYRLFNYTTIIPGATPMPASADAKGRPWATLRPAAMNIWRRVISTAANGLSSSLLLYLGWFVSPYALVAQL
jgi:uncharacterized membrane protein